MGRAFRGLRGVPDQSYDAVVVGAGIGGLICANLLARAGLCCLLVEQHYMVGGYCSTFRRAGFTFDAATHFYPLLGNPSTITGRLLVDLGVRTRWIKMDPVDHFHLPDGTSFTVPASLCEYLAKLKHAFPHEQCAIDDFFGRVREGYLTGLLYFFREREGFRLSTYRSLTVEQVLDSTFHDHRLKLLLAADCGHWGAPPSRTSFLFDSMLRLGYFLGNYYPEGGSQAFADELARCFEEQGGQILMSSRVRRIRTANHRVSGVDMETGTGRSRKPVSVTAQIVVSNADLVQTVEQLLEPNCIAPEYTRRVRNLRPTLPCFLLHVGLKSISTETLHAVEGYHWDTWNAEQVTTGCFKIFVPTLWDPRVAPPGGHIVIVQKLSPVSFDEVGDWGAHKSRIENEMMIKLEHLLPGISEKMIVKCSASAYTSWRYTLNHQGAMLGWEMSPEQLGSGRPSISTPVRNLYLVGHWTQPGGGITPIIISAMRAVKEITGQTRGSAKVTDWMSGTVLAKSAVTHSVMSNGC